MSNIIEKNSLDNTLLIQNLPINTTENDLYALFNPFGDIRNVELLIKENNKNNKLSALIEYELEDDCEQVILNMNGYEYKGSYLSVGYSKRKIKLYTDRAIWKEEDYYIKHNIDNSNIDIEQK